ncbi:MAG: response regulator [Bacteroidales bacterium]|nr:response regulator [Bacteroidales bacterium]
MTGEKSTILYVDDDSINLEIFREFFQNCFNVITVKTTSEADEILKKIPVKVIISDQCMPHETGIDFIKRINTHYPDAIKIILTAFASQDMAVEAINEAGVFKYLLKPWKYEALKETIDSSIREFDLRHEKKQLLIELQEKNDALVYAYKKLEANEKKFHAVFSNSNDSIYILNPQKQIIEANKAFLDLTGCNEPVDKPERITSYITKKFPILINKPFELAKNIKTVGDIELNIGPNDDRFIEINSNKIYTDKSSMIFSIIRDISDRRMLEKKIVEAIIHTQEEDQAKYARELHDGLGPLLSTLKMHIQWIADPNNSVNKEKITEHAILTIDKAISSVKEIANGLSPHILQRFGLVNAVSAYIGHIKQSTDIEFLFSSNLNERLKPNVELGLYRIILECINNSVKHARAKKIIVKFNKQHSLLFIELTDNGRGFDVQKELNEGSGMGLFNIRNRVNHIGGELNIISNVNIGTEISIIINVG